MKRIFHSLSSRMNRPSNCAFALLCGAMALSACATTLPILPALTTVRTEQWITGKFVWIDLIAKDVDASTAFYGALFGWTFERGERYTRVLHDGEPIAGIVPERDPKRRSEWVGNLSVPDVDASVETFQRLGGELVSGPLDAPNRGRIALVRDAEGALLLLIRASGGDPVDGELKVGTWFWRELWTKTPEQAQNFYKEIVGYEIEDLSEADRAYAVFKAGGRLRAGIVHAPPEVHPVWLPYVRVDDAVAVAKRAESLGARIVARSERSAICVDPGGAPFGIQVWTGTSDKSVEEAR